MPEGRNPKKVIDFGDNEEGARLKARLKSAISGQNVPAGLAGEIRQQIRETDPKPATILGWTRWVAVAAAITLVTLGIWTTRDRWTGGGIYADGPPKMPLFNGFP